MRSPLYHPITILIIIDRRDWRDTRGKWPLVRNPDTSLKLFWPQPMAPWSAGILSNIILHPATIGWKHPCYLPSALWRLPHLITLTSCFRTDLRHLLWLCNKAMTKWSPYFLKTTPAVKCACQRFTSRPRRTTVKPLLFCCK